MSKKNNLDLTSLTLLERKSFSEEIAFSIMRLNKSIYVKNKTERLFFMDHYAHELVYNIITSSSSNDKIFSDNSYNPIEIAKNILSKSGNEKISINEIAPSLGMSQSTLTYYFKKEENMTPKQNQIKMQRAKDLLTEKNVTEVSMTLGFENISHFIRLFKQQYGMTPKQYIVYS